MSIPTQFIEYLTEKHEKESIKASKWSLFDRTGSGMWFDELNTYGDYNYLLKGIDSPETKNFLDFGCETGRNIRNLQHRVGSVEGVDFVHLNMEHACKYLTFCGYNRFDFKFYDTNGYDLTNIADNTYDCIISSLTMQKIEIYDIRYNYLREFLRVLKPGGEISIQMGYGSPSNQFVAYNNNTWEDIDETPEELHNNYYDRFEDVFNEVSVDNVSEIQNDLDNIGFINFTYELAPAGPGSTYPQWIYFKASKVKSENLQAEAPIISESKPTII